MPNTEAESNKRVRLSDYKRELHLQKEGVEYRGECPICVTDRLSLSKTNIGKWRPQCRNGCDWRQIVAFVKSSTAEFNDIQSALTTNPSYDTGDDEPPMLISDTGLSSMKRGLSPEQWEEAVRQCEDALDEKHLGQLASALGVTPEALKEIRVGWDTTFGVYTFPEVNAQSRPIGICWRRRDSGKGTVNGSRRGLYVPANFKESTGPIFLPEGASDVAAALTMGLVAVGRASANCGEDHLVELLKTIPVDREIVVLGEMDPSTTGNWPGKDAAIKLAETLAKELGRIIYWALPPKGKDIREYLRLRDVGVTPVARGRQLLEAIAQGRKEALPTSEKFHLQVVNAAELLAQTPKLDWLVQRLLVRRQPAVMGGPQKSLKTTLGLDLALSMALGNDFLEHEHFKVPHPLRVCMLSGESGEATIHRTIQQQLIAKRIWRQGRPLTDKVKELLANLHLGFRLPQFGVAESVKATEKLLEAGKFDVLFVDPLYLCLLSGNAKAQASSMFDMGPLLMNIAELCETYSVTPILLHHFPKGKGVPYKGKGHQSKGQDPGPPELSDLAFSGIAEFARQWLLIGRREEYMPGTGVHKLYLNYGGSAGFSNCIAIDVDQGVIDDQFEGLKWEVKVRTYAAYIDERKQEREKAARLRKLEQAENDRLLIRRALEDSDGKPKTRIADETGIDKKRIGSVLTQYVRDGGIIVTTAKRGGKEVTVYQLTPAPPPEPGGGEASAKTDGTKAKPAAVGNKAKQTKKATPAAKA